MDWGSARYAFYGLGAAALATSLASLQRRLQLSKAKHSSLAGHARLARRLAPAIGFSIGAVALVLMALPTPTLLGRFDPALDEALAGRLARLGRRLEARRAAERPSAAAGVQMSGR